MFLQIADMQSALPQDFEAGEVIFREPPLVAAQHTANKADALVCAQCFRFLGSIERQLQHRLLGDAVDTSTGPCCCTEVMCGMDLNQSVL